jgi:hypothetical protein
MAGSEFPEDVPFEGCKGTLNVGKGHKFSPKGHEICDPISFLRGNVLRKSENEGSKGHKILSGVV